MSDPLTCPNCKVEMNVTHAMEDGKIVQVKPMAMDYSLCAGCLSFLQFDENLKLRAMTVEDVSTMPDGDRITLTGLRKMVEEGRSLRGAIPKPLDSEFVKTCDAYLAQMVKDKLLPELQEKFGDDLGLVVIVKKAGDVGAYCGGPNMDALAATKLLRDGAKHMARRILEVLRSD